MVKVRDLGSRECEFESRSPYYLVDSLFIYLIYLIHLIYLFIMIKDVFVLKIVHPKGEQSWVLGSFYSKVHLDGTNLNEIYDACATRAVIKEVEEQGGEPFDTLDFIVGENNEVVFEISKEPCGFKNVKCFYITLNGNTVEKLTPVEYSKENLKYIWKKYGIDYE